MIRTKSIYTLKEPLDGLRLLVTRYYPRGIKKTHFDTWDRNLAPSKELLRDWKNGKLSEDEYTKRFENEMENAESRQSLLKIVKMSKVANVTLLCIEKEDGSFCHRHVLKKIIDNISQN